MRAMNDYDANKPEKDRKSVPWWEKEVKRPVNISTNSAIEERDEYVYPNFTWHAPEK